MWLSYSGVQEAQDGNIRTFQLDEMHFREQIFIKKKKKKIM
jgi:hypothetical protein